VLLNCTKYLEVQGADEDHSVPLQFFNSKLHEATVLKRRGWKRSEKCVCKENGTYLDPYIILVVE
jgi:hypothetical protein